MNNNQSLFDISFKSDRIVADYVEELPFNRKQLRASLPADIKTAYEYMTNKESDIYKYRYIKKSVLDLAVSAVNHAIEYSKSIIDAGHKSLENGTMSLEDYHMLYAKYCPFLFEGYHSARLINITYKMCAMIPLLLKRIGTFNLRRYYQLVPQESLREYPYEQVTFIPAEEFKRVCGEHSASDYSTIKTCLEISNIAKVLSDRWSFKQAFVDPLTEIVTESGEGIAKPIFVNPAVSKELSKESELIAIPSNGLYNEIADGFSRMPKSYFASIYNLLKIQVSNNLYRAALRRIELGGMRREIVDGMEESSDSEKKYQLVNSIPVQIEEEGKTKYVSMSSTSAMVTIAIHEFDVFTILKYTIDDYAGRLHTCMTRFTGELRYHLKINGKPLYDIDIQSCQPMIFVSLMADMGYEEIAQQVGDKDFYRYLKSITEKTEYDATEFSKMTDERYQYKLKFMESGYSHGYRYKKFIKLLKSVLPIEKQKSFEIDMMNLMDAESELNRKEGIFISSRNIVDSKGRTVTYVPSALPMRMQRKEVSMMFGEGGTIDQLIANGVNEFFTIHDAVVVPEEYANVAQRIMQTTFEDRLGCERYGLIITAKKSPINKDNVVLEFE